MTVLFAPWALARMPSGWTGRALSTSLRALSTVQQASPGGVAERLNAPVLKTGSPSRGSRVRISPPPPTRDFDVAWGEIRTREQLDNRVRQLCGAKLDARSAAPSPRGVSGAPAARTIPPPLPSSPFPSSSHVAARVIDARGLFSRGVRR